MTLFKNKPILFLIIGIIILILIMIIARISNRSDQTGNNLDINIFQRGSSSPTTNQSINLPAPDVIYDQTTNEQDQQLQRESKVADLLEKLPYQGNNFNFSYSFQTNQFILQLDSNQGNIEFDQFLKTNEIQDRSWFKNLIIN